MINLSGWCNLPTSPNCAAYNLSVPRIQLLPREWRWCLRIQWNTPQSSSLTLSESGGGIVSWFWWLFKFSEMTGGETVAFSKCFEISCEPARHGWVILDDLGWLATRRLCDTSAITKTSKQARRSNSNFGSRSACHAGLFSVFLISSSPFCCFSNKYCVL